MSIEPIDRRFSMRVAGTLLCAFLIACQASDTLDPDRVIEEASQLIGARRYREGLEKMQALVEANPDDARIQMYYGQALISTGQPSLAVWPLSRAIREPEYLVPAGLLLAQAQRRAGSGIDAIHTATRVLDVDPENEAALYVRIDAYLQENMEERALEDLERVAALTDDPTKVALLRLDALLGLRREEEAAALLSELTEQAETMRETDPANAARLCAATATFTFERGDSEGAKERFDACLEDDGVAYGVVASAAIDFFDRAGEKARATDIFKRRFESDRDRLDMRVQYANRLQQMGRVDEGEKLLLEATESQPAAWAALADLYAVGGQLREAIGALDRVIEADPANKEDWIFSRSDFLLALGEVDEAEAALESLEVPAHRALVEARIAFARGDFETAVQRFEEGIRLWPDNPDARYLAGRAYERVGNWKQAAAHYREAARMTTPHYAASLALAELQRALGDMEGVQFLLARLAERYPDDPEVAERMLRFAWDTGATELAGRALTRLRQLPRRGAHVTALVARRIEPRDGPEAALQLLSKSKLDPSVPAHFELLEARVQLLLTLERNDEALAEVEAALANDPESARVRVLRASVHRALGNAEAAATDLREAREKDDRYLPALLELAALEEANGHDDRAQALYREAIPIEASQATMEDPGESAAALALARLELDAGEAAAARSLLREVLDRDPRQGHAAWLLLESYPDPEALGDAERSDLALRAAVFGRNPEAQDYLNRLDAAKS